MRINLLAAILCFWAFCGLGSFAQPADTRGVGLIVGVDNFSYTGNLSDGLRYDYQGQTLGIAYRQPYLNASVVVGPRTPTLVDISASVWPGLRLLSSTRLGLTIPVMITSGHRRSLLSGSSSRWTATRLGVGTGVLWMPPRTEVAVRAIPTFSVVSSELSSGYGLAPGAEFEALLPVRVGAGNIIELGYTFRYQVWNVNARQSVGDVDSYYDYRSLTHGVHAALRF